jgi:hypothetical protein
MTKTLSLSAAATALLLFANNAALAGDAKPAAKNTTLSFEFSPEYKTSDSSWADDYVKAGISHVFDNNFVVGSSFQYQWRNDSTSVDQIEASAGYKFKSGPFTLTPSAYLGYGFGDQPKINPAKGHGGDAEAYYAVSLAGDLKLNDNWTWNVFNARYRNAFDVTWITPKISTGITYKFDSSNAVYVNVGYAWKDKGDGNGLQGDKWNVAVGYKLSF